MSVPLVRGLHVGRRPRLLCSDGGGARCDVSADRLFGRPPWQTASSTFWLLHACSALEPLKHTPDMLCLPVCPL